MNLLNDSNDAVNVSRHQGERGTLTCNGKWEPGILFQDLRNEDSAEECGSPVDHVAVRRSTQLSKG